MPSNRRNVVMTTKTASLWQRALRDSRLQDLPFKIETNAQGQLILSPHKPAHSHKQSQILRLLDRHVARSGESIVEFAVDTPQGIKVPDVVWISEERWAQVSDGAEASPVMPELCVEVLSETNTTDEMAAKRALYFDAGAEEMWTCDLGGSVRFYTPEGEQDASTLAPSVPTTIE